MSGTASIQNTAAIEPEVHDAAQLRRRLRRATARARRNAFLLTAPLLAFLVITFIAPIAIMLFRSIDDPVVGDALPRTVKVLANWNPDSGLPPEEAYKAVVEDLTDLRTGKVPEGRTLMGKLATRLNFETAGVRSTITRSARQVTKITEPPYKDALIKANDDWGQLEIWATIKRLSPDYTPVHFLASVDMQLDMHGDIVPQPENRQIYLKLWWRTFMVAGGVTLFTLLLGYPVAYLLATLPMRISNLLMIMVLLPFWTSLLVRTASWIVVLGPTGVLLEPLAFLGLAPEAIPERPQLIYNMTGTMVAMTHILLPFQILPLYSVMKGISPSYMRAAQSLGARPSLAFWRVYLPQTVPGIGAGCILVFILAIGYYITPALVGGQDGQLISNFIAFHMQKSLNWGFAAALGALLLAGIMVLYWLYDRIVGINNMKLG